MAEGVCAAGTGVCVDNSLLVNENDILLSVQSEGSVNLDTLDSLKSTLYMLGQNGELCSNFTMSSVDLDVRGCSELDLCRTMESDNEEFSSGFQSTCEENEDNCRKKRCADRYDSSESSDSGVAVLSCTDCSGSSSGTSDIIEPGSPFSTTSSNSSTSESDPENSTPGKMPPTQSTETATWPWSGDIEQDRGPHSPPKRSFHEPTSVKRLKTNSGVNNNVGKRVSDDDCVHKNCCKTGLQQGKITEYFKAQIKLQKKCDISVKVQKNGTIVANNNKLAVYLSGNSVPAILSVPVVTKLPDVFQREQNDGSTLPVQLDEVKKFVNVINQNDFLNSAEKCNSFSFITPPSVCRESSENHGTLNTEISSVFIKPKSVLKTHSQSVSSPDSDSATCVSSKPKSQEDVTKDLSLNTVLSSPSSSDFPVDDSSSSVSSTSLSVSVNDSPCDKPSLPSPILSAPRTIRFPVRKGWKGHSFLSDIVCRWTGCEASFSTSTGLLEHLQVKHVNTQSLCETFVCLWVGCKVYDRSSCSRSWLERHVLSHGGNKPFRCIVDGCGHRFSSQTMLERHVNSHFSQDTSSNGGTGARKSLDATPNKLFRRNGKKLRYRRQPFSARMFDYFDVGIMEGLQHSLIEMTERRTQGAVDVDSGNTITLYSKLMARRSELDGTKRVLLRWFPPNIISDEWVNESEVQSTRQVPLPSLSQSQESVENCVRTLFRRGNTQRCSRRKTTSALR